LDLESFESLPPNTKILIVVAPHNPTGHSPSVGEWEALCGFCERQGLALVVDCVFGAYALHGGLPRHIQECASKIPVFWLDGLSKAAGEPQAKLAWIRAQAERPVLDALEYILDASLSVSAHAQESAPRLLAEAPRFQEELLRVLRENQRKIVADWGHLGLAPLAQGGWYQPVRLDHTDLTDEEWTLDLLEKRRILVQPGFLYDFSGEWVVFSLLNSL
jgi:aspartate/methionine/tyrosine aminotransferase